MHPRCESRRDRSARRVSGLPLASSVRAPPAARCQLRSRVRGAARRRRRLLRSTRSRSRCTGPLPRRSPSRSGARAGTGVDLETLWSACELVDASLGDVPVPPLSPRDAVRAAEHRLPAGLVASLDERLRAYGLSDRLDDVLEELARVRMECGWPPLGAPISNIVGSQALLHVLSAQRWQTVVDEIRLLVDGRYGSPPHAIDPVVRRAVELTAGDSDLMEADPVHLEEIRDAARGIATSEEELLLLALFGEDAEMLLRTDSCSCPRRGVARDERHRGVACRSDSRADRPRPGVRDRRDHDRGRRDAGHRQAQRGPGQQPSPRSPRTDLADESPVEPSDNGVVPGRVPDGRHVLPRVQPGATPFVEVGDTVESGQTLCILEAMKLMNEVKAESDAIVRRSVSRTQRPWSTGSSCSSSSRRAHARSTPSEPVRVRADPHRQPRRDRRPRDPGLQGARDRERRRVLDDRPDSLHVRLADAPSASARRRRPRAT